MWLKLQLTSITLLPNHSNIRFLERISIPFARLPIELLSDNSSIRYSNDFRLVAPPETFIGGGAKNVGVWGRAPENFSLTTPYTLAINVTNAPFIGWDQDK